MDYSPWGRKQSDMTERLHFISSLDFESTLAIYSVLIHKLLSLSCCKMGMEMMIFNIS